MSKPVIPYDNAIQDSYIEQQTTIFDLPGDFIAQNNSKTLVSSTYV